MTISLAMGWGGAGDPMTAEAQFCTTMISGTTFDAEQTFDVSGIIF